MVAPTACGVQLQEHRYAAREILYSSSDASSSCFVSKVRRDGHDLVGCHAAEVEIGPHLLGILDLQGRRGASASVSAPETGARAIKLTCALSSSIEISSSHTVLQNSTASLATSSSSLFMPRMVRPKRAFSM